MNTKFKYVKDGCDPKLATTIDQLLGYKREVNLPYQKLNELEAALKTMNLLDMQSLAIKMGIKPSGDRRRLVRACTDQFVRLTKTYGGAKDEGGEEFIFDPSKF